MADRYEVLGPGPSDHKPTDGTPVKRLKDMGNGTWAEVVDANLEVTTIEIGKVDQGAAGADPWATKVADGGSTTIGAKADTVWNGADASPTVVAILKAVYAKVATTLGFSVNAGTTDATTMRVITASDGPLNTNLGTTADVAVTSDAVGSVSAKLRGAVAILGGVWDSTVGALRVTPGQGTFTDRSGTITVGGVSQQIAAANASRRYLFVQNASQTEDLWLRFGAAANADQPSILLMPGLGFVMEAGFVTTQSVNLIAATTGHSFTAKEA